MSRSDWSNIRYGTPNGRVLACAWITAALVHGIYGMVVSWWCPILEWQIDDNTVYSTSFDIPEIEVRNVDNADPTHPFSPKARENPRLYQLHC